MLICGKCWSVTKNKESHAIAQGRVKIISALGIFLASEFVDSCAKLYAHLFLEKGMC